MYPQRRRIRGRGEDGWSGLPLARRCDRGSGPAPRCRCRTIRRYPFARAAVPWASSSSESSPASRRRDDVPRTRPGRARVRRLWRHGRPRIKHMAAPPRTSPATRREDSHGSAHGRHRPRHPRRPRRAHPRRWPATGPADPLPGRRPTASTACSRACGTGSRRAAPLTAVMEPTGMAWFPVARWLEQAGIKVIRVKGQRVRALRRYLSEHAKTDAADAYVLGAIPFFGGVPADPVYVPDAERHALQRLTRQKKRLEDEVTAIKRLAARPGALGMPRLRGCAAGLPDQAGIIRPPRPAGFRERRQGAAGCAAPLRRQACQRQPPSPWPLR